MFPSPTVRWCTSDHKRGPVMTVFTRLAGQTRQQGTGVCRVLSCLGMRAEESPARARRRPFAPNEAASNGRRWVDDWLPLHAWTAAQVWAREGQRGAAPPGLRPGHAPAVLLLLHLQPALRPAAGGQAQPGAA